MSPGPDRGRVRVHLTLDLDLTEGQERQYRLEHGLAPDDDLRDHVRDLLWTELAGLGIAWWDITIH